MKLKMDVFVRARSRKKCVHMLLASPKVLHLGAINQLSKVCFNIINGVLHVDHG